MYPSVETHITDSRNFQKHGQYELAIDTLKQAQAKDKQHKFEVEIQKRLSFNYRKLGDFNMALLQINNAINSIDRQIRSEKSQSEYAICLMNKGVIYEEIKNANKALECYLPALDIFITLYNSDLDNYGIIINALYTIGLLYYNQCNYSKATEYLKGALPYFGADKKIDRRYLAITKILAELEAR